MKFLQACPAALSLVALAAADDNPPPLKPCTARSPSTGSFFDLRPLYIELPKDSKKDDDIQSWHARGYDYPANFTLNFCGPVVEKVEDVEGVSKSLWKNISAYYTLHKKTYSIGHENSEPVIRGRKLVLNYTNGSPCDSNHWKRSIEGRDVEVRKLKDDDDDKEDNDDHHKKKPSDKDKTRRKSTIISFLCDKEPMAPKGPKASLAFVAVSEDECTYFFEVRSAAACAGIETTQQQLGPGGVFGVIMLIAVLVYLVGGCVYQRTVMHQRGWRQLPNYSMWAGVFGFIKDMFIILTSSCARFLPSRRGYSRVALDSSNTRARGIHAEDQNRLIDQLDEEWDD